MANSSTRPAAADAVVDEERQPRKDSKFWAVVNRLIPRNCDLLILMGCLMAVVAIISPIFRTAVSLRGYTKAPEIFPLSLCMIAGCLAALASLGVWRKLDRALGILTLVICGIGTGVYVLGIWQNSNSVMVGFLSGGSDFQESSWLVVGMPVHWVAVGFLGVFVLYFGATALFKAIVAKFFGNRSAKFNRIHAMIAFAIVLFVLAKIQSVFFADGFAGGLTWEGDTLTRMIGGGVFGFGLFVGLQLIPAWILTREIGDGFKWNVITGLLLASGFVVVVYFAANSNGELSKTIAFNIHNGFLFQCCYLVVLMAAQARSSVSVDRPQRFVNPTSHVLRPTLWGVLPILAVGGVVYCSFVADLSVYLESYNWQSACDSRKISNDSNQQISVLPGGWGSTSVSVSLNEDSKPNVLECLNGSAASYMKLNGIRPETDLSALKTSPVAGFLTLNESKLTCDQMELLCQIATDIQIVNLEIVDPENGFDFGLINRALIHVHEPGQLRLVLAALESGGKDLNIRLSANQVLNQSDLDSLVAASQKVPVEIDSLTMKSMLDLDFEPKETMRDVIFLKWAEQEFRTSNFGAATKEKLDRFLLKQDIFVAFGQRADSQYFWDLAFAKADCAKPDFAKQIGIDLKGDLAAKFEQFHFVFGKSETGEITDLFVPYGVDLLKTIASDPSALDVSSLESLSFNPQWLTGKARHAELWGLPITEKKYLASHLFDDATNLRRLDLGFEIVVSQADFLTKVSNVEDLTLNASPDIRGSLDFSVCKRLKRLAYYGTPPKSTSKALAKLPELEKVVIVDENDGSLTKAAIRNLRKVIGKEVVIVSEKEFDSEPPEKFKEHVRKQGELVREKLLQPASK